MMIIRGKQKKFGVKQAPFSFCSIPHELTELNPVLRDEKTDANHLSYCTITFTVAPYTHIYMCFSILH
jgi:hypothetical protein